MLYLNLKMMKSNKTGLPVCECCGKIIGHSVPVVRCDHVSEFVALNGGYVLDFNFFSKKSLLIFSFFVLLLSLIFVGSVSALSFEDDYDSLSFGEDYVYNLTGGSATLNGTHNYLAMFDGLGNLINSLIFQEEGVDIINLPALRITEGSSTITGQFLLRASNGLVGNSPFVFQNGFNIGINTDDPQNTFNVIGDGNFTGLLTSLNFLALGDSTHRVYIGNNAGGTEGNNTLFAGDSAGYQNNGSYVVSLGYNSGYQNKNNYLTSIGVQSGYQNIGSYVVAVGYQAGRLNKKDTVNVIGNSAGLSNNGSNLNAFGFQSGYFNKGDNVNFFGYQAGKNNLGDYINAFGYGSGALNYGDYANFLGYNSGQFNSGSFVNAFGNYAGYENSGNFTSFYGDQSGYENSGSNVLGIGYSSLMLNDGSNVIAFGNFSGYNNSFDNQFIVHQLNVNPIPLIQGNFTSGNVGIGLNFPNYKLQVNGTGYFGGNLGVGGFYHSNITFNTGGFGSNYDFVEDHFFVDGDDHDLFCCKDNSGYDIFLPASFMTNGQELYITNIATSSNCSCDIIPGSSDNLFIVVNPSHFNNSYYADNYTINSGVSFRLKLAGGTWFVTTTGGL